MVCAIAALAFAATAVLTRVSADGHNCGSVVSTRLSPIKNAIALDRELGPQLGEAPDVIAHSANQVLRDCENTLSTHRIQATAGLGAALLLTAGLATSIWRRRRDQTPS